MKYDNFFIVSLAALAATVTICSAQEAGPALSQAAVIRAGPEVTVVADKAEAQFEHAVITPKAARMTTATIAQTRSADGKTYTPRPNTVVARAHGAGHALVIPKDAADAKDFLDLEEDLGVMAHILDKAIGRDGKVAHAMGMALSKWPGSTATQNLYIEGHGALFFFYVNFPLLPPSAKESDPTAKEKTSSDWEEARREISEQTKPSGGVSFGGSGWNTGAAVFAVAPAAEYDADKVEDLKRDLITALKNAAHIRKLKSDETVTVVVSGLGATDAKWKRRVEATGGGEIPVLGDLPGVGELFRSEAARSEPQAKLIIRAGKAQAEAFQTGKLSFDEFRKKTTIMIF